MIFQTIWNSIYERFPLPCLAKSTIERSKLFTIFDDQIPVFAGYKSSFWKLNLYFCWLNLYFSWRKSLFSATKIIPSPALPQRLRDAPRPRSSPLCDTGAGILPVTGLRGEAGRITVLHLLIVEYLWFNGDLMGFNGDLIDIPSGKHTKNYWKLP